MMIVAFGHTFFLPFAPLIFTIAAAFVFRCSDLFIIVKIVKVRFHKFYGVFRNNVVDVGDVVKPLIVEFTYDIAGGNAVSFRQTFYCNIHDPSPPLFNHPIFSNALRRAA